MELINIIACVAVGFSVGLITGHRLGLKEKELEYEKGYLAGIELMWGPYIRGKIREVFLRGKDYGG